MNPQNNNPTPNNNGPFERFPFNYSPMLFVLISGILLIIIVLFHVILKINPQELITTNLLIIFLLLHLLLSLIHSKNYIKNELAKEFTTTIYKNLFEKDSSEIRNLMQKYTDLKQEPLENQIKIFSEDLLNALLGKNIGIVYGQIFSIPCRDLLYRNLGLTANIFEDKETTVEMAKLVKKIINDFD